MEYRFIYLHGFNSAGDKRTDKVQTLSELGEVVTIDYDSFRSYGEIFAHLSVEIPKLVNATEHRCCLIGTSLGGYWANKIGCHLGIPAILLNPSIKPSETLTKHVGIVLENFKTGERNTLNPSIPETYPDADREGNFLVIVGRGDEVLNARDTIDFFDGVEVVTFDGGSHRFEHMGEALVYIGQFLG